MTLNASKDARPTGRLLNRSPELAAHRAGLAAAAQRRSTIYDWASFSTAPAVQLRAFDDSCRDLHDAVAVGNHEVWGDPLPSHLSGGAVQLRERLASRTRGDAVHAIADQGLSGAAQRLPHADRIAASFGRHDVSNIRAHVDGAASSAARKLGAHGYASGDAVAFASRPDLFTAAHEAAHVVQQRAGVALSDGVGRSGDVYERHADEVAGLVVRGQSAEGALDRMAGAGKGASRSRVVGQGVQLRERGTDEALDDEETSTDAEAPRKKTAQAPGPTDEDAQEADPGSAREPEGAQASTSIGTCYEPRVEQYLQTPEANGAKQPKGAKQAKGKKSDKGKESDKTEAAADYSDADVAAVRARWAEEGSITTSSEGAARTPEFNRWHRRFEAALKAKGANKLGADEAKAMRDWVKAYDARGSWELTRRLRDEGKAQPGEVDPVEPPQPGPAPAAMATLKVNLGTGRKPNWKEIGAPPPLTHGERTRYAVQVPGSNAEFRYADHVQSKHTTRAEGVADSGKVKGGKQISQVFAGAGIESPDAALVNRVFTELSPYEGGFDAINTYDAGHISVGFIQFITSARGESHSLVEVLRDMKAKDPAMFTQYFRSLGIDVDGAGLVCVDLKTGKVLRKADAVATIISDKRLTAAFARAGREVPAFQHAQARIAYRDYYRPDQRFSVTLTVKAPAPTPQDALLAATETARAEAEAAAQKGKKGKKAKKNRKKAKNTVTVSGLYRDVFRSLDGKVAITDRGIQYGTGGLSSTFKSGCQHVVDAHALTRVSLEDLAAFEAEIIPFVKNRHALGLGA